MADFSVPESSVPESSVPQSSFTERDRGDIIDLYARYSHAYDGGDAAGYAALFAKDGSFDRGSGDAVTGREALAEMAQAAYTRSPSSLHIVSNVLINVRDDVGGDGRTAAAASPAVTGSAYVILLRVEPDQVALLAIGHYRDTFTRDADGWRFQSRRFEPRTGPALAGLPLLP